jgi:putative endonuclease
MRSMLLRDAVFRLKTRLFPEQSLGDRGERAAAKFLRRQRYRILHRGYRILGGELDIVAVEGRTVVFVEVKTRVSHDAGHPAEAVDLQKQKQLTQLALAYLRRYRLLDCSTRFDVVAITWPPHQRRPKLDHIKNAFEATGNGQMFS